MLSTSTTLITLFTDTEPTLRELGNIVGPERTGVVFLMLLAHELGIDQPVPERDDLT